MTEPIGWYLGLRYMRGRGLRLRAPGPFPPDSKDLEFVFCDQNLLWGSAWRELLSSAWRALAVGGYLLVWVPEARQADLPTGATRLLLDELVSLRRGLAGTSLHEAALLAGHCWVVWRKEQPDAPYVENVWRKAERHLLLVRFGGYGDALMASSVLPGLRAAGWTVSALLTEPGAEALAADPHLAEIITLRDGQIQDAELPALLHAWTARFDRYLNLGHSVEGELLKHPARGDYFWSDEQRRRFCSGSYLARVHQLADVPAPYAVRFYPTAAEKAWAASTTEQVGPFVLWSLRGSAVHKWWPYMPEAICRLLARTPLAMVLAGDAGARPLEDEILAAVDRYYGSTERIFSLSGQRSARYPMALAHYAACVVGPETGLLHAVSMEAVPKVLLLSHSVASNLSDDWQATTAVLPTVPCYPCHRLHFSHDFCPQDTLTQAAACAASILPEMVVTTITTQLMSTPAVPWWAGKEAA